eukprot:TRINITY_DN29934_c0_g1_i1.p1 TRINITY_DN29934_c0_g1~~TRINITY_DN29934_c0_g1_i1.p1  ORF type:complete len:427 (+),score=132.34 TRINITY_DN29934_c0_g1_i1:74-1354(+)
MPDVASPPRLREGGRARLSAPLSGLASKPTEENVEPSANGNGVGVNVRHPSPFASIMTSIAKEGIDVERLERDESGSGVFEEYTRLQSSFVVSFTPPISMATPSVRPPTGFDLDKGEFKGENGAAVPDGLASRDETGEDKSVCSLNQLPKAVEQWAVMQRTMHEEEPQFTFALQGQGALRKNFSILVFLLTQGSGKDKLFKLLQNIAGFVSTVASSPTVIRRAVATEGAFSRYRKVLRTFKILTECNKILNNYEENRLTRRLMHAQHICSIFYYALDHVLGVIDLGMTRVSGSLVERIRAMRNVASTFRLLFAFPTDYMHYASGVAQEAEIREQRRQMAAETSPGAQVELHRQAEIHAIRLHRAHLKRGLFANVINFTLLCASLGAPVFRHLTTAHMSFAGIVTALLGIYKVLRRIADNQLTLQFA